MLFPARTWGLGVFSFSLPRALALSCFLALLCMCACVRVLRACGCACEVSAHSSRQIATPPFCRQHKHAHHQKKTAKSSHAPMLLGLGVQVSSHSRSTVARSRGADPERDRAGITTASTSTMVFCFHISLTHVIPGLIVRFSFDIVLRTDSCAKEERIISRGIKQGDCNRT